MEALGIDILIALWLMIFGSMLLVPHIRRGDDFPTTGAATQATHSLDVPFDLREVTAMVSDRDLTQAA